MGRRGLTCCFCTCWSTACDENCGGLGKGFMHLFECGDWLLVRTVQGPQRWSGGSSGGYYDGRVRDWSGCGWGNRTDGNRLSVFIQGCCGTEHEREFFGWILFECICNRDKGLLKRNKLVVDQGTGSSDFPEEVGWGGYEDDSVSGRLVSGFEGRDGMSEEIMSCANSCKVGPDDDNIMNCHCDCFWRRGGWAKFMCKGRMWMYGKGKDGVVVVWLFSVVCRRNEKESWYWERTAIKWFSLSPFLPPRLACNSPLPLLPGFTDNSGDEIDRARQELIRYALSFLYLVPIPKGE